MALIFLHIPKAAGTTLNAVILRNYDRARIFKIGISTQEYIDWFTAMPEEERKKIQVIMGHMSFGLHEHISQPCKYITMLRDPVARVISTYSYVLRQPVHYLHEYVKSNQLTLEDFVSSKICTDLDNGQTRRIAGVSAGALRGKAQVDFGNCSNEILEEAKRNLVNHFVVTGLQDYFDESLLLMQRHFAWKQCYYVSRNIGRNKPKKKTICGQTIKLIEEYNALDIELYQFAKKIFLEQINAYPGLSSYQLKQFRTVNHLYGGTVSTAESFRSFGRIAKASLKNRFLNS